MAASSSPAFFPVRDDENGSQIHQQQQHQLSSSGPSSASAQSQPSKKRRNQPGNPNPDAEIIALSPKTLMATNRFVCEVCNKGFQREQNLQLHRRGHNLPWKLKQKTNKEVRRKVYLCPEPTCVHHDPARALGDLTGIKKHFSRKHGEKKYKCDKCSKKYAVQSDWKAHSKTCGTRDYRCDCGTVFSRRDSFITHRAFCDALAQESARNMNPPSLTGIGTHLLGLSQISGPQDQNQMNHHQHMPSTHHDMLRPGPQLDNLMGQQFQPGPSSGPNMQPSMFNLGFFPGNSNNAASVMDGNQHSEDSNLFSSGNLMSVPIPSLYSTSPQAVQSQSTAHMSATALLQKAAQLGSTTNNQGGASNSLLKCFGKSSDVYQQASLNANNFGGAFGDNGGGGHLHDLMTSIAAAGGGGGSYGVNIRDIDEDDQYYNGSSAFNPNGTGFGRLTRDFLGVGQMVRTSGRDMDVSSLDSQPGNTSTSSHSQAFGGQSFK